MEEQTIVSLANLMDKNETLFATGPILIEKSKKNIHRYFGGKDIGIHLNTRRKEEEILRNFSNQTFLKTEYIPGAIFLCRSKVLKKIGLLDKTYFFSGEIADLCKRATIQGYESAISLKETSIHDTNQTLNTLRNSLYLYYGLRNRFLYLKKFNYKNYYKLYWIQVGFKLFIGSLLKLEFITSKAIILAVWHGISGQFGNKNSYFLDKK